MGQAFFAPYDVVLTNIDVVEPDLLYFTNVRAADVITRLHARGAPNLVVEVASPSTRGRDVRVYRRDAGAFGRAVELAAERRDVLTTPLLPGLEIPLTALFAE